MKETRVVVRPLGGDPYPVRIGPGLLRQLGPAVAALSAAPRAFVVTSRSLESRWLPVAMKSLKSARVPAQCVVLPDGERAKTFSHYEKLLRAIAASAGARDTIVVALGGGVIGDLAGFAAATWKRGVPCVQVPTTLLAAVDSSVGGKTGIDLPEGKNLVGAFHQPAAVLMDTDTLRTLPPRELRAGMAEVLKYGLIFDAAFFRSVVRNAPVLLSLDPVPLARALAECVRFKAAVVATDPLDRLGRRALLNFGHTFAHGFEAAGGYRSLRHGEAVAAGMVCAAELSRRLGRIDAPAVDEIARAVRAFGLPAALPRIDPDAALSHIRLDKKFKAGKNRFVLLNRIGEAVLVSGVPEKDIKAAIRIYC